MTSPAELKYVTAAKRIRTLREAATDRRIPSKSLSERQVYYHAALAAYVATWDAYINNLVRDFYAEIDKPSSPEFHAIFVISQQAAERALERFNTPNWENTRALLLQYTGYDPINDWGRTRRSKVRAQVQERLNEILRVRHSFSHGFPMPAYDWTQSPNGKIRLTSHAIRDTEAFFGSLVGVTDKGMTAHIEISYGLSGVWK